MEPIYVRDYQDLLDGNLLAPYRFDMRDNEVGEDYEGEVWTQERGHRIVYISGGTFMRACGGPEEGGWWYDHFDPVVEFCLTVYSEDTLRQAISHVEALVRLRYPEANANELGIYIQTGDFYRPGRQHYE